MKKLLFFFIAVLFIAAVVAIPLLILIGLGDWGDHAARRSALRPLDVGQPLELKCFLTDGSEIDIRDYEGKVVLVDFWATWCGPCLGEFPGMIKAYEEYHDRGFEIIGYSVDDNLKDLKTFLEERELPWLIASGKFSKRNGLPDYSEKYRIRAIPRMILVGKDGKIINNNIRGRALADELEKLFLNEHEETTSKKNDKQAENNET